jgi:hypothetical protein
MTAQYYFAHFAFMILIYEAEYNISLISACLSYFALILPGY